MSRYGGTASVGRMWTNAEVAKYDDYGYGPPKSKAKRNAAIGGTVVGGLGVHQLMGSRNVAASAQRGLEHARQQHATNTYRLDLANAAAARQTKGRAGRRAAAQQTAAQNAVHNTRQKVNMATKWSTPEAIANRTRNMRRVGGGLLAGGTTIAAAPWLLRKRPQPEPVTKTITQARYGGTVEAGRRWRGEEKRDRSTRDVALGGAGVGIAGTGAAAGGHRALKRIGRTSQIPELERSSTAIVQGKQQMQEAIENARRAKRSTATGKAALAALEAQHAELPGRIAAEQARLKSASKVARRVRGGGLAAAGLGGAVALGAGIKAEKERRPLAAVRKAVAEGKAGRGKKLKAMLEDTRHDSHGKMKEKDKNLLRLRGETDLGKRTRVKVQNKGHHVRKGLKEDLEGNTRRSKEMEDLKSIKRRLKTLPDEDKFALEAEVRGNIRMREGKEEKDSPKKVKRRLKELPKADKFALEQDLHAKPIKMRDKD